MGFTLFIPETVNWAVNTTRLTYAEEPLEYGVT